MASPATNGVNPSEIAAEALRCRLSASQVTPNAYMTTSPAIIAGTDRGTERSAPRWAR